MQEDDPCENAGCYHYCNVTSYGDAQCGCYRGYRLYKNRRSCVDIDECYEYESGGCYHYCHNTLGSYYCLCEIGYYLSDDGLSCSHGDATYPASSNEQIPYLNADPYSPPLYPEHIYPNDPYYQNPPQVPNIPYQRYPAHQIPLSQQGYPSNEVPYGHQAPVYPDHQIPPFSQQGYPANANEVPYGHQAPVYPDHQIPPFSQQGYPSNANEVPYGHQAPVYPDHQIPPFSQQGYPSNANEVPYGHQAPDHHIPFSQQGYPSNANEVPYGHQAPDHQISLSQQEDPSNEAPFSQQEYPSNEIAYGHQPPEYPDHQIPLSQQGDPSNEVPYGHPYSQQMYPEEVPYYQRYPDLDLYHSQPLYHSRPYHSYLGDDPHFAVLLPSGVFLCYSVQGEHDKVFNLISNPDVHINALFIPDAKREEVTWIGSLGIVTHPRHSGRGNRTYISFFTDNSSITVTHLFGKGEDKQWRTVSLKSTHVASISLSNGEMWVTHRTGNTKQPTVEVTLSDVKLNFTVKFVGSHLDMFWQEVGEQPELSHGLIGQFYRQGVEIDGVRKMLIIPHKEPIPIMRRPIWSFMERENDEEAEFCWTAMNSGFQGHGLIDGNYLNYKVSDLLSTDFSPANVHHRQHGRQRKV